MTKATKLRETAHARIYQDWLELPAYKSLSRCALHLLQVLLTEYRPGKNGFGDMSARQAGERIGASKSQGARALSELEEKGWLVVTRVGKFQARNKPSRYALTRWPNDASGEPASHAYRHWRPMQKASRPNGDTERSQKREKAVPDLRREALPVSDHFGAALATLMRKTQH